MQSAAAVNGLRSDTKRTADIHTVLLIQTLETAEEILKKIRRLNNDDDDHDDGTTNKTV